MELNVEKIKELKSLSGLTWGDIARAGKLKSRQSAFEKCNIKSVNSADFFGRIFNIDPKELIK
jgi:hypothetical protein